MTAPIHIDGEIQSDTKKDDTSLLDVRLLRIDFSRQQASSHARVRVVIRKIIHSWKSANKHSARIMPPPSEDSKQAQGKNADYKKSMPPLPMPKLSASSSLP